MFGLLGAALGVGVTTAYYKGQFGAMASLITCHTPTICLGHDKPRVHACTECYTLDPNLQEEVLSVAAVANYRSHG